MGLMQPIVGINCDIKGGLRPRGDGRLLTLSPDLVRAVVAAGGVPVLLPPLGLEAVDLRGSLDTLLDRLDGLILSGGDDMHPRAFGQPLHPSCVLLDPQRDAFDLALARAAISRNLPLLGICGGMQLLAVVRGGTLHQHLADREADLYHGLLPTHAARTADDDRHAVDLHQASQLAEISGALRLVTNSRHHQGVDRPGDGVTIAATAADGVIEAIELTDLRFGLGVQWHPEEQPDEPAHRRLFAAFVAAAGRTR